MPLSKQDAIASMDAFDMPFEEAAFCQSESTSAISRATRFAALALTR